MGYARAVSSILPERVRQMLNPGLSNYRPEHVIRTVIRRSGTEDPVLQAQAADLATWLPGRMLVKVDRASMAHGLEVRPPMLDYRLVEWCARLPRDFKVKGANGKRVLKCALADRLPDDVLYRRKQGFGAPVDTWFRGPDSRLTANILSSETWKDSGYFDVDRISRAARRHARGKGNYGQELWSVLMFDAFLNRNSSDRHHNLTHDFRSEASSNELNVA